MRDLKDIFAAATTNWRDNVALIAPEVAASPLPSRQLKRATARQIAKTIAAQQRAMAMKPRSHR